MMDCGGKQEMSMEMSAKKGALQELLKKLYSFIAKKDDPTEGSVEIEIEGEGDPVEEGLAEASMDGGMEESPLKAAMEEEMALKKKRMPKSIALMGMEAKSKPMMGKKKYG